MITNRILYRIQLKHILMMKENRKIREPFQQFSHTYSATPPPSVSFYSLSKLLVTIWFKIMYSIPLLNILLVNGPFFCITLDVIRKSLKKTKITLRVNLVLQYLATCVQYLASGNYLFSVVHCQTIVINIFKHGIC